MIAFVHIYKTAGTTFTVLLRNHFGARHLDRFGFRERWLSAADLRKIRRFYPGLKSLAGHPVRPMSDLEAADPDIRFYTFMREPVARSISHFGWFLSFKAHDGVMYGDLEEVFMRWAASPLNQNRHCHHLSASVRAEEAVAILEHKQMLVLRVDRFHESLLLFRHWAGEPGMDVRVAARNTQSYSQKRLKGEARAYTERINAFTRRLKAGEFGELLANMNREDLSLYQHATETLWPLQVAAYPGNLTDGASALQAETPAAPEKPSDRVLARAYRNLVFKPARRLLLDPTEPTAFRDSEWY